MTVEHQHIRGWGPAQRKLLCLGFHFRVAFESSCLAPGVAVCRLRAQQVMGTLLEKLTAQQPLRREAIRDHAAVPFAYACALDHIRGDALCDQLPLKLRHVAEQRQPLAPDWRRGVEVLRDRNEADAVLLEEVEKPDLVFEAPGNAVQLCDEDRVDQPRADVTGQILVSGPVAVLC